MAVALVTTGAGSSNALTGALAAFMDSTQLIVISGNEPSKYLNARTRVLGVQGYHSAYVAGPLTKWACCASYAPELLRELNTGYAEATSARMGPVWIDVPRDIQTADVPKVSDVR